MQVVAGDQNAVALDGAGLHLRGRGLAEGLDVRLLEQLHGLDVHLPRLDRQVQKLLGIEVDIGESGEEAPLNEGVHLRVGVAQFPRMVKVGADAFDGEEQVVLQTCHDRFLSTDSFDGAACAPGSLGALVAEHIRFLNCSHFYILHFDYFN